MSTATSDRVEPRDHVVQFYEHDDELVTAVTRFVIDAMQADETVIVVATADHAAAFDAALTSAGVDVAAARVDGTFISFNADDALSRFLVDDWPNADAFALEIGSVIRRLVEAGRGVRVFGEMVAVLWDAGHVSAAIELETIWNHLGSEVPFTLFCAYPMHSVSAAAGDDSFQRVCHCHSGVVGDVSLDWQANPPPWVGRTEQQRSFPAEGSALSATRHFVASTLESWNLHHYVEDASIVVSELATNAVIHAHSAFTVSLSFDGGTLRVSVRDSSQVVPVVQSPIPTTVSGRGLILVTSIATRWGTELVDDGKLIWADIDA